MDHMSELHSSHYGDQAGQSHHKRVLGGARRFKGKKRSASKGSRKSGKSRKSKISRKPKKSVKRKTKRSQSGRR